MSPSATSDSLPLLRPPLLLVLLLRLLVLLLRLRLLYLLRLLRLLVPLFFLSSPPSMLHPPVAMAPLSHQGVTVTVMSMSADSRALRSCQHRHELPHYLQHNLQHH